MTPSEGQLDPLGFVADDLLARGALIERTGDGALAILPGAVASHLALPETLALACDASEGQVACKLGAPLVDRLIADAVARVPIASVVWHAEPPSLATAEAIAERLIVRNGVADVLGAGHASATYLAAVLAWTAEADDRYEGMTLEVAHDVTAEQPDAAVVAAVARLLAGDDDGRTAAAPATLPSALTAATLARRVPEALAPRLAEVGAAIARRRDRERARIDEYFQTLIAEAKRPRRQVAPAAVAARVAALHAEHLAKLRDLGDRYTLRVKITPVALVTIAMRVAAIRVRLRRRRGEREVTLRVPPGARSPDALTCAACVATTRAPVLCDDALHVLCESCAPTAAGRPRCPACRRKPTR